MCKKILQLLKIAVGFSRSIYNGYNNEAMAFISAMSVISAELGDSTMTVTPFMKNISNVLTVDSNLFFSTVISRLLMMVILTQSD